MTREEAINLLDNLIGMVDDSQSNDYDTALRMGIDALKADRGGDLIRRQDAIRAVMTDVRTERTDCLFHANMICKRIDDIPSAEQKKCEYEVAFRAGECEMFYRLTSVEYGKECYFHQDNGTVYSRISCKTLPKFEDAVKEWCEYVE